MTIHRKKYIAAAAGFLLLFALIAGILIFLSQPEMQLLTAAAGTYKDSEWVPVLKESDFFKQDNISASAKWHSGAASGNLNLAFAGEETGIFFRTGILGASVDVQGVLSEDTLRIQIPMAGDVVYTHKLKEETPFFDKLFGKRNASGIDKFLQALSAFRWKKAKGGNLSAGDFSALLKGTEMKKIESRPYEIDGKEVFCRGFSLDISDSVLEEETGFSPEEFSVYIYRHRLAAVRVKNAGEVFEICFLGGKNRDSQVKFVKEGEFSVTVKGERQEENFLTAAAFVNNEGTRLSLKGELEKSSLNLNIRRAEVKGKDVRIEGDIVFTPGGEVKKLEGETMDLEHLSETQKQILTAVFRLFRIS